MNKLLLSIFVFLVTTVPAFATGQPEPWQIDFQEGVTSIKEHIHDFHTLLLIIITGIVALVTVLMAYTLIRFRRKANPVPSKTTHNVPLEILWTLLPCLVLIVIAVPSFKLMYYTDRAVDPEMTIKVTGYQWYWGYEYPDHGDISFLSYIIPEKEIKPGQVRLLETDNPVVVPVDTDIRVLITAADVLHAWTVPAFGVKKDAVPGRINEIWFNVNKPGTYYGQCSEICGVNHGYMPIQVKAVSKVEFARWVEEAKEKFN